MSYFSNTTEDVRPTHIVAKPHLATATCSVEQKSLRDGETRVDRVDRGDQPNAPAQQTFAAQPEVHGALAIGDQNHVWSSWHSECMGSLVAMDTETSVCDAHVVPELALVSVSNGTQSYLLKPEQLSVFLTQHLGKGAHLVYHNVAFDFAVIDKFLDQSGATEARRMLWDAVDTGRIHDTMLLASLVDLARRDLAVPVSLAKATQEWCGYELEKDEFRMRFAETIGQSFEEIEPGFLRYAAADAIATIQLYQRLLVVAHEFSEQHNLSQDQGMLTETIQVKAAISLDRIYRNGLCVDQNRAYQLRKNIDAGIQASINKLATLASGVWHRDKKTGAICITDSTGLPRLKQDVLEASLTRIGDQAGMDIPKTGTGKPTTAVKGFWSRHRDVDPLIGAYCTYKELTKLGSFFGVFQESRIHPKYQTLVRTGRTSCSGPNIQQLPARIPMREVITATPGNVFFIVDYNSLELRTLAAVCFEQFGFSHLRDVLIEGVDPHCYTAAMFANVPLDEFKQLPDWKQRRQKAKVFNFGLPAGFGAASLVGQAKSAYDVEISHAEAEQFIELLTKKVYPELALYLAYDGYAVLADSLGAKRSYVEATFPEPYSLGMVRKVVEGSARKYDGSRYKTQTVATVWRKLGSLCRNKDLREHVDRRDTSDGSPLRRLFSRAVATMTGRLRGAVPFTVEKNTPFQGLAADGCKQAMWNLTKAEYRIAAFIHDEFIIELPATADFDAEAAKITSICSDSMQAFVPGIPVPCEFAITERWYKQAEAVYNDKGRLEIWRPPASTNRS